jgi:glutamyl-tRNA synthetase/nondiscriminating glutamyl-tRNA synthetase
VFDEDKLAWVNRHYLKMCAPDRLAALAEPYLRDRGQMAGEPSVESRAWLEWVLPGMAASVDRLPQLADRLDTVFTFDAARTLANAGIAKELGEPGASAVVRALAEDLQAAPRLVDKETFRAAANRVRDKTGQKGKALFHPMRLVLTGASEGPELDLIVPAIERAAGLAGLAPVVECRQRAASMAAALGR